MILDANGNEIRPGDVLQSTTEPEMYFAAYVEYGKLTIRDIGNNNVGTCEPGIGGDVVNLGHWTRNLGVLCDDDISYYFAEELIPLIRSVFEGKEYEVGELEK